MDEKTTEARLQELKRKKEILKRKKHALQKQVNGGELRKQRTKRLIETGAIFEKYFECNTVEEAEQIAIQFGAMIKKQKIIRADYVLRKYRNE